MKKSFINPFVLLSSDEGGTTLIGGDTGMGSSDAFPMSYAEFLTSGFQYDADSDLDGEITVVEFAYWWLDQGFTIEQWNTYAGVEWPFPENPEDNP